MKSIPAGLLEQAMAVRERAHAAYSGYRVGAAVLDEQGRIHAGCNVENASFPEGICAEANAIGSMVAAGGREIVCIAVVGGHEAPETCTPCGGCRQRIREFAGAGTRIVLLDEQRQPREHTIDELLPLSFSLMQPG